MEQVMNILSKPCGMYETNCYILGFDGFEFVVDPGVGATEWVIKNTTNLVAILNTHGHFDHVWSNAELKEKTGAKIYIPKGDAFMLTNDIFGMNMPSSIADIEVAPDACLELNGVKVTFHHFPGHTPGCSAVEVENELFSGDFVFAGSIGRTDFPYSSSPDMIKSLLKFGKMDKNMTIYPGHGAKTTVRAEQSSIPQWLRYLEQ
jgi:glyoxylase-like metal-dependent hydrolase (beta-lactamase superfamily II)